jgi:hypothetical protein
VSNVGIENIEIVKLRTLGKYGEKNKRWDI